MNIRILLCEGSTDLKFFQALLVREYRAERVAEIPRELKIIDEFLRRSLLLELKDFLIIVSSCNGKDGVMKTLGLLLNSYFQGLYGEVRLFAIAPALDIGNGIKEDVQQKIEGGLNNYRGMLKGKGIEINIEREGETFLLQSEEFSTNVVPFPLGIINYKPLKSITPKSHELEDVLLLVLEKEGLVDKLKEPVNELNSSLGRAIEQKHLIYLGIIAKDYWSEPAGFYEKVIGEAKENALKGALQESNLSQRLQIFLN